MAAAAPRFRATRIAAAALALIIVYVPLAMGRLWTVRGDEDLALLLFASIFLLPVVSLIRFFARARIRAGGVDPFATLQRWSADRPRLTRALLAAPVVASVLAGIHRAPWWELSYRGVTHGEVIAWTLAVVLLPWAGLGMVVRASLRGFLAPLVEPAPEGADGFSFSAVAVTPEARAAVGGLFALTAGVATYLSVMPLGVVRDYAFAMGLFGYAAAVLAVAFAFQRVSRIGLGFDGVIIKGSSRTRFFAYRDVDEVEVTRRGDVVLLRHGRAVLRLQLHGQDDGRHAAIAERIREGLARAALLAGGGAQRLAEASGAAPLARAARGQADYRAPGVTREELWELVEAPSTAAAARTAAAQALGIGADHADRSRLRIAAATCAEPVARATLVRVAGDDGEESEEETGGAAGLLQVRRVTGQRE